MKQITKSYLEYLGVTEVTPDGRVFTKNGERKLHSKGSSKSSLAKQKRFDILLYDTEKYKAVPKNKRTSNSGIVTIRIHHIVYAWFNNEIPYGKEIHHIDGNCLNNSKDNLIALTHAEHVKEHRKMRENEMRELKCRLDIPRDWYQKQLDELEAIEHKTKVNCDKISVYRAKLRYYDNHIDDANKQIEFKKDLMELKAWKQVFKENNNKKLWHECCTIEKIVKEKGLEAQLMVKHALDVCHKHFEK